MCDGGLLGLNKTGFVFRRAECPLCFASIRTTNRLDTCAHSAAVVDGTMMTSATWTICVVKTNSWNHRWRLIQGTQIEFL